MASSVTFLAPSGTPANLTVIQQLVTPGSTSGANHVGFFGAGGPGGTPYAVIVDRYQDATFITNMSGVNLGNPPFGLLGSGKLLNHKYVSANTVSVSGLAATSLTNVTQNSGTLLIRFNSDTSVRTQNVTLYTVALNASSGIDDPATVVTGLKVQGYEVGADGTWTQMAGVGATDNRLIFDDHTVGDTVHDFFVGLSVSPEDIGLRTDFGFYFLVEFL